MAREDDSFWTVEKVAVFCFGSRPVHLHRACGVEGLGYTVEAVGCRAYD